MCKVEEITYIYPDASRVVQPYHSLCEHSVNGQPCRTARRYYLGEQFVNNSNTAMDNRPSNLRPLQQPSADSRRTQEGQSKVTEKPARRSSIADRAGEFVRPAKKLFEKKLSRESSGKEPLRGKAQAPHVNQPNPPPRGRPEPTHGESGRLADTAGNFHDNGAMGYPPGRSASPPPSVASEPVTEIRMPPQRRQSQREYRPLNDQAARFGRDPETPPYTPHSSWGSQQRYSRPYTHLGQGHREAAGHPVRQEAYSARPVSPVSPASISPDPPIDPEVTRWDYRERRRAEAADAARRANEEQQHREHAQATDARLSQVERALAQANARIRAYECHEEERNQAALEQEQQLEATRRYIEERNRMAQLEQQIRELRRQRRSAEHRYDAMLERNRAEGDHREPRRIGTGRRPRVEEVRLDDGRIVRTETRRDNTRRGPHVVYIQGAQPRREGITARQAINDARERARLRLEGMVLDDDNESDEVSEDEEPPRERRRHRRYHRRHRRDYDSL